MCTRVVEHLEGDSEREDQSYTRATDRQTDRQRRSDTYREDDTSTLPPTPLHDHTSSLPLRVPGTSSLLAGCHSRRMTGFSSTVPFPLLTLNCHTLPPPCCTPPRPAGPAGPYCFLACSCDSHSDMHAHTSTDVHVLIFLSVIYTQSEAAPSVTSSHVVPPARLRERLLEVSVDQIGFTP